MAQKAELKGKLNLDSSGFKRGIAQSKKSVSTFASTLKGSLLPVLGAAGAAGAMISLGRNALTTAKEIKNLAGVAGLGVEEFQRYADAAKTVNIDQSKLADIFKDTSDKMGDFMQADSGAMVDFFEQIAPAVGATKEEFIGLNGADSLQKYFSYLEQANIPHQDMVFYMEAIASDATMLIPLLENGGEAFRTLGDGAEAAGRIIKDDTIEALVQAQNNIDRFSQKMTVIAGNIIGAIMPAKDAFEELARVELEEEGLIRVKQHRRQSGAVIRKNNALIQERAHNLRVAADEEEAAAKAQAILDAKNRRAELDAIELEAKLEKSFQERKKKADKVESDRKKAEREKEKAEKEAARAADEAARKKEEAIIKEAAERITSKKLALLKAQASQDVELTNEAQNQLDLEEKIQGIMQSANVDRQTAIGLAKELAAIEAGADTNQSGYVTGREQRAKERADRKAGQERRKRERKERSDEVGADQRARDKAREDRMTEREKANNIDTGRGGSGSDSKKPSGEKAKDQKDSQAMEQSAKDTADNTKEILTEIQKNPS
tara:strand:- start:652 stop:2298 length:1647 start_codon:yes stop_codon:yes gene_type:complete